MTAFAGLGHRLRVTRIALGLTEQEAAEAFGVALATYRKYENRGLPERASGLNVMAFARKYRVSMDWLFDGDPSNVKRHVVKGKVAVLPVKGTAYRERLQNYYAAVLRAESCRRADMPPYPYLPLFEDPLDSA
jgi:transcriptional regulator with XRE-family HTH domain